MRVTEEKAYRHTYVAEYTGIDDFATALKNRKYDLKESDEKWAGGTTAGVIKKCGTGDASYAQRSSKLVDKIANLAMEGTSMQMDYNPVFGMLDRQAMEAGNPMCMYGVTITESGRSPVAIYVDNWISATMPREHIIRRGIAVLALVQAVSVYRPVHAKFVSASGASFDSKSDNIQLIPLPTMPMDLGRAAWALASTEFTRAGVYCMANDIHDMYGYDCGPMMGSGAGRMWQSTQLGEWAAKRDGVKDYVFLPMMVQKEYEWSSDAAALKWVQKQVNRLHHTETAA